MGGYEGCVADLVMQVYSIVNIVFITQSLSTLDSTFTSAGVFRMPPHEQTPT